MKNLFQILFLGLITLSSCALKKSINLIDIALSELKIKKTECLIEFVIEQNISNSESILLIPKIAEKEEEGMVLDAHLLIVNKKNGKIKSKFSKKEYWFSDAVILNNIEVVYQPYQISKNSETIGVLLNYYVKSRATLFSSKELTLFVKKGKLLVPVLENFPIYTLNGESNGNGNSEYVEHNRTIQPEINAKKEFYDLKVSDSLTKTKSTEGTDDIIENLIEIKKMEYKNGEYKNVL